MKHFNHWAWLLLFLTGLPSLVSGENDQIEIVEAPSNHVWDYDDFFRNDPKIMGEISEVLVSLEDEYDMEVFLVLYSSLIGENLESVSKRCHGKWLGDDSEGIVFVLSLNGGASGVVGRSRPLYEGHFLEDGKMPRVPNVELEASVNRGIVELMKIESPVERVRVYTVTVVDELRDRLQRYEESQNRFSHLRFMGWMAFGLIACALLIGLLSKLLGTDDRRSRKTYLFPEFTVPQRLRAPNGGGKISAIDFGSPSSDA